MNAKRYFAYLDMIVICGYITSMIVAFFFARASFKIRSACGPEPLLGQHDYLIPTLFFIGLAIAMILLGLVVAIAKKNGRQAFGFAGALILSVFPAIYLYVGALGGIRFCGGL